MSEETDLNWWMTFMGNNRRSGNGGRGGGGDKQYAIIIYVVFKGRTFSEYCMRFSSYLQENTSRTSMTLILLMTSRIV
jgi:hypothetical protein